MASPQHYNETTMNEMMLSEDLSTWHKIREDVRILPSGDNTRVMKARLRADPRSTRSQTHNIVVYRSALSPTGPPSQGYAINF